MTKDPYDSLNTALPDEHNDNAKLEQQREVEDLKWLMSNKRGRRIVYQILSDAGVFRLSFNTDALQMAFNEGSRNLGLKILMILTTYCPARYAEMIEESAQ